MLRRDKRLEFYFYMSHQSLIFFYFLLCYFRKTTETFECSLVGFYVAPITVILSFFLSLHLHITLYRWRNNLWACCRRHNCHTDSLNSQSQSCSNWTAYTPSLETLSIYIRTSSTFKHNPFFGFLKTIWLSHVYLLFQLSM